MEQKFNTDLITNLGPDKLLAELKFDEMVSGWDCGGGTYKITKEEVEKFAALMGDSNTGAETVPVGMIYIYGLRICWDRKVFIDQAVRAGDKITFFKPAKISRPKFRALTVLPRAISMTSRISFPGILSVVTINIANYFSKD